MIGCGIYSAVVRNWRNVLILAAASALLYGAYLLAVVVIAGMQALGDSMTAFLRS